jgi:copper transport protein
LAATFSATGHPVTGRHVPLAFTADLLHLMAMGLWLGGLAALAALGTNRAMADGSAAPDVSDVPDTSDASLASGAVFSLTAFTRAVRRFSTLATWCVGVLAVTGTLQSIRELGSVGDLPSTNWGRYLLVKLAVVLTLLTVAFQARSWTHRHTARRADTADGPAPVAGPTSTTLRRMRRTLALEASVGAVVLALSVMLAGSPPPSDRPATTGSVTEAAMASPVRLEAEYDTGGADGSGTAVAVLTPRADGRVTIDLTLTTTDDIPIPAQPTELTASMFLPAQGIGPLALNLEEDSAGHWTASTTPTPKGKWQLALTIRTSDIDQTTVTFPATTL